MLDSLLNRVTQSDSGATGFDMQKSDKVVARQARPSFLPGLQACEEIITIIFSAWTRKVIENANYIFLRRLRRGYETVKPVQIPLIAKDSNFHMKAVDVGD